MAAFHVHDIRVARDPGAQHGIEDRGRNCGKNYGGNPCVGCLAKRWTGVCAWRGVCGCRRREQVRDPVGRETIHAMHLPDTEVDGRLLQEYTTVH